MTDTGFADHPDRPAYSPAQERQDTIACVICGAIYTPSPHAKHLLQGQALALESTFMSICHFCFRCRRPACPSCWDQLHGLCGSCDQEVGLPFRVELPQLRGSLTPPPRQMPPSAAPALPDALVRVGPGRFESAPPTTIDALSTDPLIPSLPARSDAHNLAMAEPTSDRLATLPPRSSTTESQLQLRPQNASPWPRLRQFLLLALGCILLALALLIFTAVLSTDANAFIAHVIGIDIRGLITYLLLVILHKR